MEGQIRTVERLEEALDLAPILDRHAAEAPDEFHSGPIPPGVSRAFLEAEFGTQETLLLVAERETGAADLGICLVGPFVDPLTRERVPMLLVLAVESAHRHCGLARAMVGEVEAILSDRGFARLAARAPSGDDALVSMGERWGFVRTWEFLLRE